MAKRRNPADIDPSAPNFEESLAGLEAIVEAMENQQLPLEELVSKFEQGSVLLDRCESFLNTARERIELITLRNRNESAAATAGETGDFPESEPADDTDDDDIRLF
jgi:exodeoxyribonuclease VII small subunit